MKFIKLRFFYCFVLGLFLPKILLASRSSFEEPDIRAKSSVYRLNDERTIAHFYPIKAGWEQKLNSTAYFHSPVFLGEGLVFSGVIDLERFLDAMHHTLQEFDFLFCQFSRREGELYASYSTEHGRKPFIQLEIERTEEPINASTLASILPTQVDERIQRVVTDDFEDLALAVFKLKVFGNGFSIGSYLNHAFFDQSSTVYFFKYLSHTYSFGNDHVLKKPNLIDIDSLPLSIMPLSCLGRLSDFREHSEALMGFKYSPPMASDSSRQADDAEVRGQADSYETIILNFNMEEISKLKSMTGQYLSPSDIINATLLKIYSFNPKLSLESIFSFGFACNMRKYCGLGEEAIGNVLSHPLMPLKLGDIKDKTLVELAILNREQVSKVSEDFFKESLVWYQHLQKYHENPMHYAATFGLLSARVTNWSTFDYDSIRFDEATLAELKAPCLAAFKVNVISFGTIGAQKFLRTSISVPSSALVSVRELASTTGLFSLPMKE